MRQLLLAFCLASLPALAEEPIDFQAAAASVALVKEDGQTLRFDSLRGRPAVVNFWATWCPPCREELPLLAKAQRRYGKQVAFLGLAVENNREFAAEFARVYGLKYPVATGREPAIALMRSLGNEDAAMPFTVVLDAQGRMTWSKRGLVTEKDLSGVLAPLLRK